MKSRMETIQKLDFYVRLYCDTYNNRIRVDEYRGDLHLLHPTLLQKAKEHLATKLIVKARGEHVKAFLSYGYVIEGVIDGYFRGSDAWMMAYFLHSKRRESSVYVEEVDLLQKVLQLENAELVSSNSLKKAGEGEAEALGQLYRDTFQLYPVPLHDPNYIKQAMSEGTIFYYFEKDGEIISAASAEVNANDYNAELTDCATVPSFRKGGLMKQLLQQLEMDLQKEGIFCFYSLARALSFGMNAAFQQLNYSYRGRLINNCYIFDKLEDMNIWVKSTRI
ncbi:putative beta-lysine N-acetyltransferase [Bacillus sp. 2205SS5-2]|uniref:putative beta-lysine N-acetyltransferase n=1 Tax=Bacillus sp. 2205SS5-2 TaxID=3109031 RepID=UPI0030075BB2